MRKWAFWAFRELVATGQRHGYIATTRFPLHLSYHSTVTPLEPCCYLICLRRGHVCKGPFWWFSHFNAYQDHLGSHTFKQICRWFQSRWSEGTLGNSASKNHAGSLDQNVTGHAQESLFSQTHRLILTLKRRSPVLRRHANSYGVGRVFFQFI